MEAGKRSRAAAAALLLPVPDDLLVEILLRIPPEPIYLFRASFTCKHWRGLVHDACFLSRFREFNGGMPPVLGFFNNQPRPPRFVPISDGFTLCTATMSHEDWWTLDCRHGRALLFDYRGFETLLVWDLMTGGKRYIRCPPAYAAERHWPYNGAVLRAPTHDHRHPHPFLVAFVFTNHADLVTSACVYSSKTGVWGEITSIHVVPYSLAEVRPTALVGNALYLLSYSSITVFDLDKHRLDEIEAVPFTPSYEETVIMQTKDGLLGFAGLDEFKLHLWSRVSGTDGVVSWTHRRVIDLERLIAINVVAAARMVLMKLIGYAEDADVIFIGVYPNMYMISTP